MKKLKSKRLTKPKKIVEAWLGRAADKLLGLEAIEPKPQMDWKELRKAKVTMCHHCSNFDVLLGGCKLHLMPSKKCKVMKLDKAQ